MTTHSIFFKAAIYNRSTIEVKKANTNGISIFFHIFQQYGITIPKHFSLGTQSVLGFFST